MRTRGKAALGAHSNVVVNLTAREAVAVGELLERELDEVVVRDPDARSALKKLRDAAERAVIPWPERPPS